MLRLDSKGVNSMLVVTDRAAAYLKKIYDKREAADEKIIRLVSSEGSFELIFAAFTEKDHVFQSEGADVLIVAPEVAELLVTATLDVNDKAEGPRLTLSKAK